MIVPRARRFPFRPIAPRGWSDARFFHPGEAVVKPTGQPVTSIVRLAVNVGGGGGGR